MNSDLYEPIILSIAAAVLVWWIWQRPPGHPYRTFLRFGILVIFLDGVGILTVEILGKETGIGHSIDRWLSNINQLVIPPVCVAVVILLLHSGSIVYRSKKLTNDTEDIPETASHKDTMIPTPTKHSLTLRNNLDRKVMVSISSQATPGGSPYEVRTRLAEETTELVQNAVLEGGQFYIIAAKEVTGEKAMVGTKIGETLFIRRFTWEQLEAQGWTVVIEPGYGEAGGIVSLM